jgi:hypothetical protein
VKDEDRRSSTTHLQFIRYTGEAILGGVIYLHDMTQDRFTGAVRRNIVLFNHLCGSNSLNKVIIATTKWSRVDGEAGEKREAQCKQLHWKPMIEQGTTVCRWTDDSLSAREMVDFLLAGFWSVKKGLHIQEELVDQKKIVAETNAGQQLRYTIKQIRELQMRKSDTAERAADGDEQAKVELEDARRQIENLNNQLRELKVPFARRLLHAFL